MLFRLKSASLRENFDATAKSFFISMETMAKFYRNHKGKKIQIIFLIKQKSFNNKTFVCIS